MHYAPLRKTHFNIHIMGPTPTPTKVVAVTRRYCGLLPVCLCPLPSAVLLCKLWQFGLSSLKDRNTKSNTGTSPLMWFSLYIEVFYLTWFFSRPKTTLHFHITSFFQKKSKNFKQFRKFSKHFLKKILRFSFV